MIRLHVLTACTRPSNLTVMGESLIDAMCEPWELCWHVRFNPEHDDLGGHRLKNEMLDQIDDGWVVFLDDDTVMHPDLLRCVAKCLYIAVDEMPAGVVVSQDRTADLGHMLWATPENMHLGGVDIGQVVLTRELIGDTVMPAGQGGDGVFLQSILRGRRDVVYLSEVLSYYNALES